MISTFYLGTDSAENYGIIMTAPPDHVIAERDIERKEVPGRSGDVIIDNGRYKNITVKYSCAILPEDGVSFRTAVTRAVQFLKPGRHTSAYAIHTTPTASGKRGYRAITPLKASSNKPVCLKLNSIVSRNIGFYPAWKP